MKKAFKLKSPDDRIHGIAPVWGGFLTRKDPGNFMRPAGASMLSPLDSGF